jgi:hypothetical protein
MNGYVITTATPRRKKERKNAVGSQLTFIGKRCQHSIIRKRLGTHRKNGDFDDQSWARGV